MLFIFIGIILCVILLLYAFHRFMLWWTKRRDKKDFEKRYEPVSKFAIDKYIKVKKKY